ncbi:hypothetical protein PSYJYH_000007 [Bacillus phage PSYJ-YH]|nr:hypothetical protein PSYJYH_000007 [Bacillus phage PSYJ-YH]
MNKPIKIKMFTKTVCPNCKIAKQQLSFVPVPVEIEEINIETYNLKFEVPVGEFDSEGFKEGNAEDFLINTLKSYSTPTFLFESGKVVRGFEMGEIMEELGL